MTLSWPLMAASAVTGLAAGYGHVYVDPDVREDLAGTGEGRRAVRSVRLRAVMPLKPVAVRLLVAADLLARPLKPAGDRLLRGALVPFGEDRAAETGAGTPAHLERFGVSSLVIGVGIEDFWHIGGHLFMVARGASPSPVCQMASW